MIEYADGFTTDEFRRDFKEALNNIENAEDRAQFIIKVVELSQVRKKELPQEKRDRLVEMYGISEETAEILTKDRVLSDSFECTEFICNMKKGCV